MTGKTQAFCSQQGPDGLNEADHQLAEIRASQQCEELGVAMFLDDVWETLGNTAEEGFWKGTTAVDRDSLSMFWQQVKSHTHQFAMDLLNNPRTRRFGGQLAAAIARLRSEYEDTAAEKIFNKEVDE